MPATMPAISEPSWVPLTTAHFRIDAFPHRRVYYAGTVDVDRDLVFSQLLRGGLAHASDGEFRSRVSALPLSSAMCRDRGGANQSTAAALGDHLPRRRLVAMQHTLHVDVHGELPLLCRDLQQRSGHRDARVRHHDVQAAEVPYVGGDRRLHARRLGHVNSQAKGYVGAAEASNQRLKLIGRRGQIRDRYSKAVGHQTFGNSSAYSARGTGHQEQNGWLPSPNPVRSVGRVSTI